MIADDNIRLLYELNAKDAQLDFAIRQAEHQLANVNQKLKSLQHDLVFYLGMLILPGLVCVLCSKMYLIAALSLLLPFLVLFHMLLQCVWILSMPFVLYHLGKTVQLLKINREDGEEYSEPPRVGTLRSSQPDREPTYRIEQKKLIYILSRYYLNQDALKQLRRRITESDSHQMTMAELKYQLGNLPFYEEIRPADPFAKGRPPYAFLTLCSFLIGLFYVFRTWRVI